ncbi:MAG: radical SAM protein [Candidatus Gracilibacteria bacterium]|nr:radical SAM protein [Candidatus Gracilibacteria bacterium]
MANIGYIQVNRHCNNACHFCSNPSNGNNISYERGIELLDDFKKRDYSGVIFTGGEPTLSPDLPKWLAYSKTIGLGNRMISNGMMCSNTDFMKRLADSGLELVHFSVYSCYEKIHDFLTDTPGSWKKLMMSITNAINSGVRVQINTVINHYNENHLDKTVMFLTKTFPPIQHIVWNNLDPEMMRKTDTAWSTLPNFDNFKPSLNRAMEYLQSTGRTFRAEKMPLCYIRGFEWCSTETRKIVKEEERIVHFLDFREMIRETEWEHEKLSECKNCDLNQICSGVYEYDKFFNYVNVYPQKLSIEEKKEIIKKIKGDI